MNQRRTIVITPPNTAVYKSKSTEVYKLFSNRLNLG